MKEFTVTDSEKGRRLDRYIMNILSGATSSFAYKMLRKKNIVLNDSKASGSEILKSGDVVRFYLSDETFAKFARNSRQCPDASSLMPPVVYEDSDILIVKKPAGMLSQRSSADDISLNEICLSYVRHQAGAADHPAGTFTPSVCNRLDRNTSGLVTFAKTYRAARCLSEGFRQHSFGKYYRCIVLGRMEDTHLTGTLVKDKDTNTVKVSEDMHSGSYIDTIVNKLRGNDALTLLEIKLVTGKTHQIRAHLAYTGHPILGDPKYGDRAINDEYRKKYGITCQMLTCCRFVIPDDFGIASVAGRTFEISLPDDFNRVI